MDLEYIIKEIKSFFDKESEIPLHRPKFSGKEKQYVLETIDSSYVSSVGPFVNQAEEILAKITGVSKAVAVVNGTAALQVALRIVGVRSGDEVITQALTFVATANSITYNGAQPVFLDVDLNTMGLSPASLQNFLNENAIMKEDGTYNKTTGKKIAACLPMHTFGFICQIEEVVKICQKWKIPVIEDAAEALGSFYQGKSAGSFGDIGVFSFNGNKIVTSGGGGAIVSNNLEYSNKAKHLTTTAKMPHLWEYYHDEAGYNFRMPNINAALLCAQLEQLDGFKAKKKELYMKYKSLFEKNAVKIKDPHGIDWNFWLISIELNNKTDRDKFLKYTNDHKIFSRPIWRLLFELPMYRHCYRDEQKNAQFLSDRIVNLPSSVR